MQKFSIYKIISFLLLFSPMALWANISPKNTPVAGGILVLDFTSNYANPKAYYHNKRLFVQRIKDTHWQVLFGISLDTKVGKKRIVIKDFGSRYLDFEVKNHHYKKQYIVFKGNGKKFINPNKNHLKRIIKERKILASAHQIFSDTLLADGEFILPVDGIITSDFGLKRFYNDKPKRPHSGLDLAAKLGTPVKAANAGSVILTGHFFFNGKTVFIDHGRGLTSAYIHLDKIAVKQGQSLKQGDIIGTIGTTGRSTGPHLHWGIYLNEVAVNPLLLLSN